MHAHFSAALCIKIVPHAALPRPEIMKTFFDRIYRINKMFGIPQSDYGFIFFHPVNPVNPVKLFSEQLLMRLGLTLK